MMNLDQLAYCQALLRAEIRRRMNESLQGSGVPGLLDELRAVQRHVDAATGPRDGRAPPGSFDARTLRP
jgi:hypothetical protein